MLRVSACSPSSCTVTGVSIRLRILKGSIFIRMAGLYLSVTGVSIRLRILKGNSKRRRSYVAGPVTGVSIRLRILKENTTLTLSKTVAGSYRGLDPFEDTERHWPDMKRMKYLGYRGLDPFEDTESASCSNRSLKARICYRGLDPFEDTERGQDHSFHYAWTRSYRGLDPFEDTERYATESASSIAVRLQGSRSV